MELRAFFCHMAQKFDLQYIGNSAHIKHIFITQSPMFDLMEQVFDQELCWIL